MSSYEKEQQRLEPVMNDALSDEEAFGYSSESYQVSSGSGSTDGSDSPRLQKQKRVYSAKNAAVASTSFYTFSSWSSVDEQELM